MKYLELAAVFRVRADRIMGSRFTEGMDDITPRHVAEDVMRGALISLAEDLEEMSGGDSFFLSEADRLRREGQ